jgi:hypothetical protein
VIRIDISMYGFPHAAGPELDRLEKGPVGDALMKMETALLAGYMTTAERAHIITGYLKSTVHPSSEFTGGTWTGTIAAARNPGIFELARGNRPTAHHAGGHYFMGPGGQDFERAVREAVWEWITSGMGGPAPSEGLGWKSGGDGA